MTKTLLKAGAIAMFSLCLGIGSCYADTCSDLEYLGFSEDITSEIKECLKDTYENRKLDPSIKTFSGYECEPENEVESTQRQLYELGMTRGFSPSIKTNTDQVKKRIDNFWSEMAPSNAGRKIIPVEVKQEIFLAIKESLEAANYKVIRLEILDLPEGSTGDKVRAVVRVTKKLKTRNSYKEIQKNLREVKAICNKAANIDGNSYLSELTTFVAENPRNKYYYEKTVLNY